MSYKVKIFLRADDNDFISKTLVMVNIKYFEYYVKFY